MLKSAIPQINIIIVSFILFVLLSSLYQRTMSWKVSIYCQHLT
jgi:hypothetical protein